MRCRNTFRKVHGSAFVVTPPNLQKKTSMDLQIADQSQQQTNKTQSASNGEQAFFERTNARFFTKYQI